MVLIKNRTIRTVVATSVFYKYRGQSVWVYPGESRYLPLSFKQPNNNFSPVTIVEENYRENIPEGIFCLVRSEPRILLRLIQGTEDKYEGILAWLEGKS